MTNNVANKLIPDLIEDNHVNAQVLHFFGIKFYDHSDKTLKQVCEEKGLNMETVIRQLESAADRGISEAELQQYSIDLIIEYLKHAHFLMIKGKLSYIGRLISEVNPTAEGISADLKLIFPFFVEDFIRHVYHEEDTLFSYVSALYKALQRKQYTTEVKNELTKTSIAELALQHSGDDAMKGLRELTSGYTCSAADLHLKVIMAELKAFDEHMLMHARIEDHILFPKALALETEVKKELSA